MYYYTLKPFYIFVFNGWLLTIWRTVEIVLELLNRTSSLSTLFHIYILDQYVATLTCTDEDREPVGNPDGCSKLSIHSGDDADPKFALINDQIVTTANPIDYDTGDVIYTLIIIGVDYSTRDPKKTGTTTITVNIEPVNEFTPSILGKPLEISVSISEI